MNIRLLDTVNELEQVERLQGSIWPGNETEIVPLHLLITAAHNGGLALGAFDNEELIGFAFGFPGVDHSEDELVVKHCSHMLGVLPDYRDQGIGFQLKRAQWQMIRRQNIPLITWTYDPLQSRNAFLNIAKLGAVCQIYLEDHYGDMRDEVNIGLASDRFQVELWVNSPRVSKRLDKRPRPRLSLDNFRQAEAPVINPTTSSIDGPIPPEDLEESLAHFTGQKHPPSLVLVEIPANIQAIKNSSAELSGIWRAHTRGLFTSLFAEGYIITDFVYTDETPESSYYSLSYGDASLGGGNSEN